MKAPEGYRKVGVVRFFAEPLQWSNLFTGNERFVDFSITGVKECIFRPDELSDVDMKVGDETE